MNLKQSIFALTAALSIGSAGPAFATGIPVVDGLLNAQTTTNQAANIAKYVEQIVQLKAQLDQAKQLFNSMNGARGMASLLNDPGARQYLPKDASQVYGLVTGPGGGAFGGLTGSAKSIKDAGAVLKSIDAKNPKNALMLEKSQNQLANQQATHEEAYKQAGERFDKLQELIDTVDAADDPKAAADLQNRIAAEQTMMQNEMAKLAMLERLHVAQQQQLAQQRRETAAKGGRGEPVYVTGY